MADDKSLTFHLPLPLLTQYPLGNAIPPPPSMSKKTSLGEGGALPPVADLQPEDESLLLASFTIEAIMGAVDDDRCRGRDSYLDWIPYRRHTSEARKTRPLRYVPDPSGLCPHVV